MDDQNKIIEALSSGPMRPREISQSTGLDKDKVAKVLKGLKAEGKVISPKRCYYGLPE